MMATLGENSRVKVPILEDFTAYSLDGESIKLSRIA
jgi:hypothetical protein